MVARYRSMAGRRGDLARQDAVGHRPAVARLAHSLRRGRGRLRAVADRYPRPVSAHRSRPTTPAWSSRDDRRISEASRGSSRSTLRNSFAGVPPREARWGERGGVPCRPDVRGGRGRTKAREGGIQGAGPGAARASCSRSQQQLLQAPFPVIVLFAGVDAAGKSETASLLNEWMDPHWIVTRGYTDPSAEELERPRLWRYWRDLPPKGRIALFLSAWYSSPIRDRVARRITTPSSMRCWTRSPPSSARSPTMAPSS